MFDCSEANKWIRQAQYTFRSIKTGISGEFYSWACFKAHQVAEFALESLLHSAGIESFGHDLIVLEESKEAVQLIR